MTKYVWDSIEEIEKKLKKSSHLLFLLDYDGTLTSIKEDPQSAELPDETKDILLQLNSLENVTLGIVSGRGIYDIKKQIDIPGIVYAGNHGMEWEIDKKIYVMPGISKTRELYLQILNNFSYLENKFKGIFIEDKQWTISIHYRMLSEHLHSDFLREFDEFIKPYLRSSLIKLLKSKMVFDILPNVKWGKGSFINWLISTKKASTLTIYIGDDRTDEDAFSQLKDAITIKVGDGDTGAKYNLKDTKDTIVFLGWILGNAEGSFGMS